MTIRVLIADDQRLVRAGFRALVDSTHDLLTVAEAGDGAEAFRLAVQHTPDVVLMDIRMPVVDGLEATREIVGDPRLTATRVVVVTTYETDETVFEALRAGASGFLLKDVLAADLLAAVKVIAAGEALLSPRITRRLIEHYARQAPPRREEVQRVAALTARESELLVAVARGLANAEISVRHHISLSTTKTHVSHLLEKLGARDRVQLTITAYEAGLMRR